MTFLPLGDTAILARAASAAAAVRFAAAVRAAAPDWIEDVVLAYATVGVHFDADRVSTAEAIAWLRTVRVGGVKLPPPRTHTIPVCYEMGPDLGRIAEFV